MPPRKNKILYIDTNVVIDFDVNKDENAVVLVNSARTRGWILRTSTFAMVELAEYKKNELFLWDKLSQNNSLNLILKKINNHRTNKKLNPYHFQQVDSWLDNLRTGLKLEFLDLGPSQHSGQDSSWQLAYHISAHSNLSAKDTLHLATVLAAALNDGCDFFITSDGDLIKEAEKFSETFKLKKKLKILTPKSFIDLYPPIKKNLKNRI